MKIARYDAGNGYSHYMEVDEWRESEKSAFVRVSAIVEVEFPPLPLEVLIPKQLAALDAEEKELTAIHLNKLEIIQNRRKDLLSLSPPKAVQEVA